jgi:hypothetical protein
MKLRSIRGGSIGSAEPAAEAKIRAARVEAARKTRWKELNEAELVPRGPLGWLIHEPTDAVYVLKRGGVFGPGRAAVEFASTDDASLAYYVALDQSVVVLERLRHPRTYTEHVERREQRRLKVVR